MGGKTDSTLAKAMGLVIKKNREKKYPGHGGQALCAVDFGVSPPEWSRWERGVKTPSAANQRNLAKFFGIYIGELWGEEVGAAESREAAGQFERGDEKRTPESRDRYLEEGGNNDDMGHRVVKSASRNQYLILIANFLNSLWPHDTKIVNLLDFLRMADWEFEQHFGNTYTYLAHESRSENHNTRFLFRFLLSHNLGRSVYDALMCQRPEISRFTSATVKSIKKIESFLHSSLSVEQVLEYFRDGLASFVCHKLLGQTEYFLGESGREGKDDQQQAIDGNSLIVERFHLTDEQLVTALRHIFGASADDPVRPAESPNQRYQQHFLLSSFSMYKEIVARLSRYIDHIERGTVPAKEGEAIFLELLKLIRHRVGSDIMPELAKDNSGVR